MTSGHDEIPSAAPLTPPGPAAPVEPVIATEPAAVAFADRTSGPGKLRMGVVAGAAVALAVGAVATSMAAPAAPSSAGGTTGTTSEPAGIAAPALILDEDGDLDDNPAARRGGFREITITAISGTNVSLTTADGWTRTIAVTDDVEITKGGQAITVADLAVGDRIRFSQTRNDDGTYTVERIAVVVPHVRGEVSELSSTGFKVTTRSGAVWTITVDGSTQYRFGTGEGTIADIANGTTVRVAGTSTGENALTALTVTVRADKVAGTVTSTTASTIVIQQRDGSSVTVHVDADTVYRVAGVEDADLGDVAADMRIVVSGRERADGSIDADAVAAGTGRGFFHGDGRGPRDGDGDDEPAASPSASPG